MQGFEKVSLFSGKENTSTPSSVPLVLPNSMQYDNKRYETSRKPGAQRTHLQIVPSTAKLLAQVKGPIAVLSVTGMARSGKSYILSRILGASDVFKLGHSMEPETYGIWIATQVLKNDKFTIILVDTEGIDAASAEKTNDVSLLVLTILLSSYFVFNTISVPKQAQLEDLECFVQLVNSLRVNKEGVKDHNNFSRVFPDFLWLLRDVNLTPTDEKGNKIDAKTFLTERLLKLSGGFEETKSDKVARAIKMFFPSLDCETLPVPSDDPEVMQNVENNQDKLSPQFNTGVQQVVEHIIRNVRPKTGYKRDTIVTGAQLVCMLETYVEAVNDPKNIPVFETSWESSLRILADRFYQEAIDMYRNNITAALDLQGLVPLEDTEGGENTFLALHRKHYEKAQDSVRIGLGPMCNEIELTKSMNRLQEAVFGSKGKLSNEEIFTGLYNEFWQVNYKKSLVYCQKLKEELYGPIAKKITEQDKGYTYKQLDEDLKKLEVDYKARSKGPAKQKVFGDFMEFIASEEKTFCKLEDFKKDEFSERQKAAELSSEIEKMYAEQQKIESVVMEEMEENKRQAEKLTQEYEEKIDKMRDDERESYVEMMNAQAEIMQNRMMESVQMIKETGERNKQLIEERMKMMRQQHEEDRERTKALIEAIQERNEKIAKDIAEQVKRKKKNPLDKIGGFISSVTSLVGTVMPLFSAFKLPIKK